MELNSSVQRQEGEDKGFTMVCVCMCLCAGPPCSSQACHTMWDNMSVQRKQIVCVCVELLNLQRSKCHGSHPISFKERDRSFPEMFWMWSYFLFLWSHLTYKTHEKGEMTLKHDAKPIRININHIEWHHSVTKPAFETLETDWICTGQRRIQHWNMNIQLVDAIVNVIFSIGEKRLLAYIAYCIAFFRYWNKHISNKACVFILSSRAVGTGTSTVWSLLFGLL